MRRSYIALPTDMRSEIMAQVQSHQERDSESKLQE